MTFDFSLTAAQNIGEPSGIYTSATGNAAYIAPTDFNVDFTSTAAGVVLSYLPVGGNQFATTATANPNELSLATAYANFRYSVTVDPAVTIFGIYGVFGQNFATATGGAGIGRTQGYMYAAGSTGCSALAYGGIDVNNHLGTSGVYSGGAGRSIPQSTNPYVTGNVLLSPCPGGTVLSFLTYNIASAQGGFSPTLPGSASASVPAAWSTLFATTATPAGLTPVPEASSAAMTALGLGLAALIRRSQR